MARTSRILLTAFVIAAPWVNPASFVHGFALPSAGAHSETGSGGAEGKADGRRSFSRTNRTVPRSPESIAARIA